MLVGSFEEINAGFYIVHRNYTRGACLYHVKETSNYFKVGDPPARSQKFEVVVRDNAGETHLLKTTSERRMASELRQDW